MSAIVGPKPIVLQRLATDRAKREADPNHVPANEEHDDIEEEDDDDDDDDDEDEEGDE